MKKIHLYIYALSVCCGLLYASTFSFPDRVPLSGDEWEYQSIAVNFIYGHGFPIAGGFEDSAKYKFYTYPGLVNGHSWDNFYSRDSKWFDFARNPLYPFGVSVLYSLCGVRPDILFLVQFMLLILSGSLLPYICYKIMGVQGIFAGLLTYSAFLYFDSHYAFQVMTEALVIAYSIVLVLLNLMLRDKTQIRYCLILSFAFATGLLLKNYFCPVVVVILIHHTYLVFTKKYPSKNLLSLQVLLCLLSYLGPYMQIIFWIKHGESTLYSFLPFREIENFWIQTTNIPVTGAGIQIGEAKQKATIIHHQ